MLDESQYLESLNCRLLKKNEQALLKTLLEGKIEFDILTPFKVIDMTDGKMGSIKFIREGNEKTTFGKTLVEAEYVDQDGILVSITVNVDQNENIYELDFWKVNFTPLKRYPLPCEVKIIP
jgi:hypothetical protein